MSGNECIYVCADDTHGTATMLRAEELEVTPESLIEATNAEHKADFADFAISHDNYYSTHSPENQEYLCHILVDFLPTLKYVRR